MLGMLCAVLGGYMSVHMILGCHVLMEPHTRVYFLIPWERVWL